MNSEGEEEHSRSRDDKHGIFLAGHVSDSRFESDRRGILMVDIIASTGLDTGW
jgi:hypothetical protein